MPILIDNSTMEKTASCHTAVAMERVLHLKPKAGSPQLEAGTAMHKAWEKFFNGEDVEVCILALREHYSSKLPYFEDIKPTYDLANLENLFRIWASKHPNREFPWVSQYVEKGFQVRLFPDLGVDLIGKMDTFGADGTGSYCVVDWKTTGYNLDTRWFRKIQNGSQVSAYLYATQRLFGSAVWVLYIMALKMKVVPMSNRTCKEHGMKYWNPEKKEGCYHEHADYKVESAYRNKTQLLGWYQDARLITQDYLHILENVKSIEDIGRVPMQGVFNNSCQDCSYREFCHSFNRKPESAEQLFDYKPWSPLLDMDKEDIFYEKEIDYDGADGSLLVV